MTSTTTTTLAFVFAFALPSTSFGQSVSAGAIARCEQRIMSQADARQNPDRPLNLDLHAGNNARLVYLGMLHKFDPLDSQFVAMQSAWRELHPTILFYEGTDTRIGVSAEESISKFGEPGLARFLAAKDSVPARSLEPSRDDEIAALLEKFSPEQLVMFFSIRPVTEARTRRAAPKPALDSLLSLALAQAHRNTHLRDVLPDTSALRARFARLVPDMDVTQVPDGWFDPLRTSAQTGSRFFNDVNRASSMFREVYMFRQLAGAAIPGARIFAEVGRDHIPAQAAALRCALEAR